MYLLLFTVYCLLFTVVTLYRFHYGLFLFFLLLPTYLISFHIGFLPTTLLEVMFWILTIVWILKWNKNIIYHLSSIIKKYPTIFTASSLFLLGATISIFTAIDTRAALGEWKAFYLEPIILFLMLITITQTKNYNGAMGQWGNVLTPQKITHTIILALLLSGLATSLLAIYQHFTGWLVPYDFWENRQTYRVTAWYGFPNAVGLFLAPVFVMGLYFFVNKSNKIHACHQARQGTNKSQKTNQKLFFKHCILVVSCILLLGTFLLAIIFAKSTGALIGIAAGVGFLLLVWKKTRIAIIVLALSGFLTLYLLPNDFAIKQELLLQDRSGQLRTDMWAETSAYLMKYPIIGTGLASYEERIYPYRIEKNIEVFHHPHNLLLTIWVNIGLIGLIGFLWLLVAIFRIAFIRISQLDNSTIGQSSLIFLLAALITILTTGLVDSPYIKNDLAMLFWGIIAMIVMTINTPKKHSEKKL